MQGEQSAAKLAWNGCTLAAAQEEATSLSQACLVGHVHSLRQRRPVALAPQRQHLFVWQLKGGWMAHRAWPCDWLGCWAAWLQHAPTSLTINPSQRLPLCSGNPTSSTSRSTAVSCCAARAASSAPSAPNRRSSRGHSTSVTACRRGGGRCSGLRLMCGRIVACWCSSILAGGHNGCLHARIRLHGRMPSATCGESSC